MRVCAKCERRLPHDAFRPHHRTCIACQNAATGGPRAGDSRAPTPPYCGGFRTWATQ